MGELFEVSLWATSDADGQFFFAAPSLDEAGVVWATSLERMAAWKVVPAGAQAAVGFTLGPADVQSIVVSRVGEESVEGARVLQGGLHGRRPVSGSLGDEEAALQLYVRVAEVPVSGQLVMPAWSGERRYRAELRELRSLDVVSAGKPIELELVETVSLNGVVRTKTPGKSFEGAILYVSLLDGDAGAERYAFGMGLDASGVVRDIPCPWSARGGYRFEVEGDGFVRGDISVPHVPAGAAVSFEIVCQDAGEVVFHFATEDLEGAGIDGASSLEDVPGVAVRSGWRNPESFQLVRPIQSILSDGKGLARLSNFPKGVAHFMFSKKGFVTEFLEEASLFESPPEPIEVLLRPSGELQIRATSGGEVLTQYDVYYWPEEQSIRLATITGVTAHDDGLGRLRSVPLGRLRLLVVADDKPQSFPVTTEVVSGEVRTVEIELPDAVTGVGRVLDGGTRLPVPEAVVEIGVGAGGKSAGARDQGQPVEQDGSFELPLFAPAVTHVTIRAPGYSPLPVMGDVGEDGRIDFGTLYITKMQPFTVRCISDKPVDWTQYYGQAGGVTWGPQLPLNADGTYVAEYGRYGENSFTLSTPEGSSIKRSWTLFGDGPWSREVRLTGDSRLEVTLKADEESMPAYLGLEETLDADMANAVYVAVERDAGKGIFTAIDEGNYSLIAYNATWKAVGCASVDVVRGELNEVSMDLAGSRSYVRLLGKDGRPISGASITLRDPDHMPNLLARALTADDAGVVELPATALDELMLSAYFPSGGFMASRRILRPKTEEPLDLVWDGGKGLFLEIFDGEVPLEGLEIWIHERLSGFPAVTLNVPADGHYERPNIGASEYFAEAYSGWVWNRRVYFDLDDEGTPVRIEFRRLGDLTVSVVDLLGNSAAGVQVELTSDEFGESVAGWLAEGRVVSGTGLVTDGDGMVRLDGLPRGAYSWFVGGKAGSVDVAVGAGSSLKVQLGE